MVIQRVPKIKQDFKSVKNLFETNLGLCRFF